MKTSKKILIGFLSILCLSLLSVMITVENPKSRNFNFEEVEEELPDFNVIVVHKGAHVKLNSSDTCQIKYSYEKDSLLSVPYQMNSDTLVLKSLKSGNRYLHYSLNINHVEKLIIEGGDIDFNLQQDSIEVINKQNGYFKVNKYSDLNYMKLIAKNKSRSQFYSGNINSLDLQVDNADVFSNSRIPTVNLQAKNKASIRLQHVKNLVVKCDSTSTYRVY